MASPSRRQAGVRLVVESRVVVLPEEGDREAALEDSLEDSASAKMASVVGSTAASNYEVLSCSFLFSCSDRKMSDSFNVPGKKYGHAFSACLRAYIPAVGV